MKTLILIALMFSPVTVFRAATPPAALGAAQQLVKKAIAHLPAWDADPLGQYERPELAAVRTDIEACEDAESDDDFLIDVEQLKIDAEKLVALDDALSTRLHTV